MATINDIRSWDVVDSDIVGTVDGTQVEVTIPNPASVEIVEVQMPAAVETIDIGVVGLGNTGGASSLDGLTDVVIDTPTTGQVLKFDGTSWVNEEDATGGGAGATNLSSTPSATNVVIASDTGTDATIAGASGTEAGVMSAADKAKLDGIAAGAEVNAVDSVAGKTGDVTLAKADVGLANVDNTSDANKPVSTATQTALNGKANTSHTHTASQVTDFNTAVDGRIQNVIGTAPANLDTLGELADALADDANFASTVTTSLAGKQPLDSDLTTIAGLSPADNDVLQRKSGSWINRTIAQLKADFGLTKSDVGLSNVDNTSDANKPISTATQAALDAKAATTVVPDGGATDEALVKVNSTNRNTTWKRMLKWFGDIVTLPDSLTQFVRVNIPDDASDTNTWPDRLVFYFNGTRTGYHNEYGEIRARAAKPSTVALRTQGHASNVSTDVLQVTSDDNATIYFAAGPNGLKGPGVIRASQATQPSTTGWVEGEFWYDESTEV
jgi:hypothetical protein